MQLLTHDDTWLASVLGGDGGARGLGPRPSDASRADEHRRRARRRRARGGVARRAVRRHVRADHRRAPQRRRRRHDWPAGRRRRSRAGGGAAGAPRPWLAGRPTTPRRSSSASSEVRAANGGARSIRHNEQMTCRPAVPLVLTGLLLAAVVACGSAARLGPRVRGTGRQRRHARRPSPPRRARPPTAAAARRRVVFLGDSLTAGSRPADRGGLSVAHRRAARARAARAGRWSTPASRATPRPAALRRLDWAIEGGAEVVVVALGGNDGLRGLPVDGIWRATSTPSSAGRRRRARQW